MAESEDEKLIDIEEEIKKLRVSDRVEESEETSSENGDDCDSGEEDRSDDDIRVVEKDGEDNG